MSEVVTRNANTACKSIYHVCSCLAHVVQSTKMLLVFGLTSYHCWIFQQQAQNDWVCMHQRVLPLVLMNGHIKMCGQNGWQSYFNLLSELSLVQHNSISIYGCYFLVSILCHLSKWQVQNSFLQFLSDYTELLPRHSWLNWECLLVIELNYLQSERKRISFFALTAFNFLCLCKVSFWI